MTWKRYSGPARRRRRLSLEGLEPRELLAATPLITEFMAANDATLFSNFLQDYPDWLEIYNPGPGPVDLEGWYLTDTRNELHTWQFPSSLILGEGEYVLVFASGTDTSEESLAVNEWHTNFRLRAAGEYLALVWPDGTTVASEYEPFYPAQTGAVSFGLTAALDDVAYFATPTPGERNPVTFKSGVFNPDRGFYVNPIVVAIDTATLNGTVHFTTDGSIPSASDPRYDGPFFVRETTTVRARAFGPEADGTVYTQTYVFLQDIIQQAKQPDGLPTEWVDSRGQSTIADYEFDPEVRDDPEYAGALVESLLALPTFSVTVDPDDLFGPDRGIYSNPESSGGASERAASFEMLHPDGRRGFQVDAGIRIHGGSSREPRNTPKHSLRISFKSAYGPSIHEADIFDDSNVDKFDRLVLDAGYADGWLNPGSGVRQRATLLRDQFVRDTARDMGQPTSHGRFVHLYLNGIYWGIYNLKERVDEALGSFHIGGRKVDYDVIEAGELDDGEIDGWNSLLALARSGVAKPEAYEQIQELIDVDNFIDFVILRSFAGDEEFSNGDWYALRNRTLAEPFQFFTWDSEHTLNRVDENAVARPTGDAIVTLLSALRENPMFRRTFADHVHRHFFNAGTLTPENNQARWQARSDVLSAAMLAESARWGDYRRDVHPYASEPYLLYTPNDHWRVESTRIVDQYLPVRSDIVLAQFQQAGLYPSVAAPTFSQFGGEIEAGFPLRMAVADGDIFFTTTGADPALPDGGVHPNAVRYVGPLTLVDDAQIKARSRLDGTWSALTEAPFYTPSPLQITEIHFRALPDLSDPIHDPDDFDFVEITNGGEEVVDLTALSFTSGIVFSFAESDITELAPGARAVLVRNPEAFAARYDTASVPIAGVFGGRLNNEGETITLLSSLGQTVDEVSFDENWYSIVENEGFSLVRRDESPAATEHSDPSDWRPSYYKDGSPGTADIGLNPDDIVISEALTHNDLVIGDWLELHNTTDRDLDIGGWYLSDTPTDLQRYRIPAGTILTGGGYLAFATDFSPSFFDGFAGATEFPISKLGEKIFVTSPGRTADDLGGYRFFVNFTYGFNSSSFVRYTNSTGEIEYVPAVERTFGGPNSPPTVDRIRDHGQLIKEAVISELMYHPAAGGDEYIELHNPHSTEVRLDDPFQPSWRFTDGVFFNFPDQVTIPPKGHVLVVPIEPEMFRAKYEVPAETQIFGPYLGELLNTGERLVLSRAAEAAAFVPFSMTDQVSYNHPSAQWPTEADGQGASLNRVSSRVYGNDVTSWTAGILGGTPGRPNVDLDHTPRVIDRLLFYNDSRFDGEDPAINPSDDDAIAVDKYALLPGNDATLVNFANYEKGINGISIDIRNLPGDVGAADFEFRVGNDREPTEWAPSPDPALIAVRRGAGMGNSDRVTIVWPDGSIVNQWLQVTVLATANTGLTEPDVHYWGNLVGDVANYGDALAVDARDIRIFGRDTSFDAAPTNSWDVNRDGWIDSNDAQIVRDHLTTKHSTLVLLTARRDFSEDGITNSADIDLLAAAIRSSDVEPRFDLNADEVVDESDKAVLIRDVLGTKPGDANMDGVVDGADLEVWRTNRFLADRGWSAADFNGDGVTDGADLNLLLQNRELAGDFTGDHRISAADVDVLFAAVGNGSTARMFDINADGHVDDSDIDAYLSDIVGTRRGDANLDGVVDGSDFNQWNLGRHFRLGAGWAFGDFDGSGTADESDFSVWSKNRFQN